MRKEGDVENFQQGTPDLIFKTSMSDCEEGLKIIGIKMNKED